MDETRKPIILIVDDDSALLELFSIVLEMSGYEVLTSGDGAQAVSIMESVGLEGKIDIIMVDLMMPVIDGLRFIRWLRTELKCTLPVLALTGMSKPTEVQSAMDAGADAVMNKPIEPMAIVEKLAQMLNKRDNGQQ